MSSILTVLLAVAIILRIFALTQKNKSGEITEAGKKAGQMASRIFKIFEWIILIAILGILLALIMMVIAKHGH